MKLEYVESTLSMNAEKIRQRLSVPPVIINLLFGHQSKHNTLLLCDLIILLIHQSLLAS